MTTKRGQPKAVAITKTEVPNELTPNKNPLVFISHDSRDGKLAEEFSALLKSASAGALKSFYTTDRKGAQGIPYGQEWYPAIMEKIDEASDVVCLLTKHSVDRPWILYEAGVAKGKLDKKVIGIAIGIPLATASTGPFAQFQNNDGDIDSITNLVMTLVKKVPGLDPDHTLVKTLVEGFVSKAKEIVEGYDKQDIEDITGENSVAKLFEEVKIMFDSLPSRIERRMDPDFRRRRKKLHPVMFEELMHMGTQLDEPNLAFLMMIGLFREDMPWLYEIGLETYRGLKVTKGAAEKRKIISTFDKALDMLGHPIFREIYGKSDEAYFFMKESRHIMNEMLYRLFGDVKSES